MQTDPRLEELLEFVRELCLEDAGQQTEIQFDIFTRDHGVYMPALLARGMLKEVWFRFDSEPEPMMEVFFKGEAWKAHFLLQRIVTGKVNDALGRDRVQEALQRLEKAEADKADDEFYDMLHKLCDMEREVGYKAGFADGRKSKLWQRIKDTINQ